LLDHGAKNEAADAAETINSNFHWHRIQLPISGSITPIKPERLSGFGVRSTRIPGARSGAGAA
jgi:hypothetical protein